VLQRIYNGVAAVIQGRYDGVTLFGGEPSFFYTIFGSEICLIE
jgi:hypothetical protein